MELDDTPQISFDFEKALGTSDGDSTNKESDDICKFYQKGTCTKGNSCPYKHHKPEKAVVCKHWLRGLCKKGDLCEFLHVYDLAKMPICFFWWHFGECSKRDCIFKHVTPEENTKVCAWYARGFCKHGPNCRNKHLKQQACENYLLGFCPDGPNCEFGHPKYELPREEENKNKNNANAGGNFGGMKPKVPICHKCQQPGHKAPACPNAPGGGQGGGGGGLRTLNTDSKDMGQSKGAGGGGGDQRIQRPLDQVQCFKCLQMGHYANKCPNRRVAQGPDGQVNPIYNKNQTNTSPNPNPNPNAIPNANPNINANPNPIPIPNANPNQQNFNNRPPGNNPNNWGGNPPNNNYFNQNRPQNPNSYGGNNF